MKLKRSLCENGALVPDDPIGRHNIGWTALPIIATRRVKGRSQRSARYGRDDIDAAQEPEALELEHDRRREHRRADAASRKRQPDEVPVLGYVDARIAFSPIEEPTATCRNLLCGRTIRTTVSALKVELPRHRHRRIERAWTFRLTALGWFIHVSARWHDRTTDRSEQKHRPGCGTRPPSNATD